MKVAPVVGIVAAGVVASGCVLAAPASAIPSYGSNGVFGVTTQPRDGWSTSFIAPGRYRVDQSPSMRPYQSAPGFWFRCSDFPCIGGNIIGTGDALRDAPTFVDILPTDVAISLHNVTLTPA